MKIVFIRHGESTGNAGIPSHDLSQIELTDKGHLQAAMLASAWVDIPSLIATSPYLRTQLTAQPTITRFPMLPVEVLPIEEFTYLEPSRWNGTSRAKRLPHIDAFWDQADPTYQDGPGAESFDTLLARVQMTFDRINRLEPGSLVYAFSHGQFMQALRLRLMFPEWSSKQLMQRFWSFDKEHPILNAALVIAHRQESTWALVDE